MTSVKSFNRFHQPMNFNYLSSLRIIRASNPLENYCDYCCENCVPRLPCMPVCMCLVRLCEPASCTRKVASNIDCCCCWCCLANVMCSSPPPIIIIMEQFLYMRWNTGNGPRYHFTVITQWCLSLLSGPFWANWCYDMRHALMRTDNRISVFF